MDVPHPVFYTDARSIKPPCNVVSTTYFRTRVAMACMHHADVSSYEELLRPLNLGPHPVLLLLVQGEAALFADVKSTDDQGNVRFTTAARVLSPDARLLKMDISCFYPLVRCRP